MINSKKLSLILNQLKLLPKKKDYNNNYLNIIFKMPILKGYQKFHDVDFEFTGWQ